MEERITQIMTAPLDDVVDPGDQVLPVVNLVGQWDLPESDRLALASWGLPADREMRPKFQDEPYPILVPNVADERERRLISPDQRLYKLIHFGSDSRKHRIGAVAGTGCVLSVRPAPLTAEDVYPQLRQRQPDFYGPAVNFIHSSVAQFVEAAWRWHAARKIFLSTPEPDTTKFSSQLRAKEVFDAYIAQLKRYSRIVLEHIERIDNQVRADDPHTIWYPYVTGGDIYLYWPQQAVEHEQ